MRGIHRWPENSPHKGPVTRKMFPFDDVIMWPGNAHTTENKRSIWHQFDNFVVTGGRGGCAVMTTYGATSDTKVKSCQIDLFVFRVRQWWIQSNLVTKPCYNTPYRQITQSLEAVRYGFELIESLCDFTGATAAVPPISRFWDFTRSCDKTS